MIVKGKDAKTVARANAISVIKKLFVGSFVILFVGVCAFATLLFLMKFI